MADAPEIIKILDYIEHEDGSCTLTMDITQRTAQLLIEVGFLKLLTDHIERSEKDVVPGNTDETPEA